MKLWAALAFLAAELLPARAASEAIPLFNENRPREFYTWLRDTRYEDPRQVFTFTNGLLRISGDGLGYIATRAVHTNYHLTVEYRWGIRNWKWNDRIGRARDSGIFLHATGPDGNSEDANGAFMAAIECNLFQGATGDFLLIRGRDKTGELIAPRVTATVATQKDRDQWFTWDPAGTPVTVQRWGRINWRFKSPEWSDTLDFRGERDVESAGQDWTRVECMANNGTIRILVNGTIVNEVSDVWPRHGKVLLQCEGSEIFFRRVDLQPLPAAE